MNLLTSGAGGEVTDVSFRASTILSKPFWTLAPLPLSQVRPNYAYPLIGLPSLQSLALNAISDNFHHFSPSDFLDLAPHLKTRILDRIKGDRVYDLDADRETHRPDEATLWAYQTLFDPMPEVEHTRSITVGLPTAVTLRHLAPNPTLARPDHPLNELPRLFKSVHAGMDYTILTSLTLGGLGGGVNDQTILALRHCTNLSILKTKDCAITDDGIRMLATALDLPGPPDDAVDEKRKGKEVDRGLGMWRLRAWYLQGCISIRDKSMQSFARWPGLVLLDVRDTGCTSAASTIFNRASRAIFACQNADFQPCTPGLLPLFAGVASPRYIAEKLTVLLGAPYTETDPFSLHIVPSIREIQPSWLPPGTAFVPPAKGAPTWESTQKSVFRGDGIGQIYGSGVSRISDQTSAFRDRVKTALFLTSRDEEEDRDPAKRRERLREEKAMWKKDWKSKQPPPAGKKDMDPYGRAASLVGGKKYRLKPGQRDVIGPSSTFDHSRTAYSKVKEGLKVEEEKVKGDVELMLVRMVCAHWEELQWAPEAGMQLRRIVLGQSAEEGASLRMSASLGSQVSSIEGSQSVKLKARPTDALADILSVSSGSSQNGRQAAGSAFRPASSQTPRLSQSSQMSLSQSSKTSQEGPMRSSSPPPMASSSPRVTMPPSSNPFRSHPVKSATGSGVRTLSSTLAPKPENRASSGTADEFDAFGGFSSTKKRGFGGAGAREEGKRRGMKMFSGARL